MRQLLRPMVGVVIAAAIATALAAAAAIGSTPVRVESDCVHAAYKPHRIVVSCGDGSTVATRLRWKSWTSHGAVATGTMIVKTCTPDCARGGSHRYPVKLALDQPRSCRGVRVFTRLRYRYTTRRSPDAGPTGSARFVCTKH